MDGRNKKYIKQHDEITVLLENLDKKDERVSKSKVIAQVIKSVSNQGVVSEFDNDLWFAVIENVVVGVDGSLTLNLRTVLILRINC